MRIFIAGGSNSLMKAGWTGPFREAFPDAVNLSIGGSNTLAVAYRVLMQTDIGPGDVVIWEYALNDALRFPPTSPGTVHLRNFEFFTQIVRSRGAALAPVLFMPDFVENSPEETPYFAALRALCDHYGLAPFDMSREYRAHLGVSPLPPEAYRDFRHYAHDEAVNAFICAGVSRAVREAQVPRAARPRHTAGQTLKILLPHPDNTFANSAMTIPCASAPLRLKVKTAGTLEQILLIGQSGHPDALRIRIEGKAPFKLAPVAITTKAERTFPLLRLTALRRMDKRPVRLGRGDVIHIERGPAKKAPTKGQTGAKTGTKTATETATETTTETATGATTGATGFHPRSGDIAALFMVTPKHPRLFWLREILTTIARPGRRRRPSASTTPPARR